MYLLATCDGSGTTSLLTDDGPEAIPCDGCTGCRPAGRRAYSIPDDPFSLLPDAPSDEPF